MDLVEDWWTCTADDVPVRPVEHDWNFKPGKTFDRKAVAPKLLTPGLVAGGAVAAGRMVGPVVQGLGKWVSMSRLHI